jgi:hypothetical protein
MATKAGSEPVRYTVDHMDGLIRANQKYKAALRGQGHLDPFMNPVPPAPPPDPSALPDPVSHDAYCVKCKAPKKVLTKDIQMHDNGAGRAIGHCPTCGTATHKFMKGQDATKLKSDLDSAKAAYAYPV